MKRKLFFCELCARVYAADVNNGVCREIVSVGMKLVGRDAGMAFTTSCGGTIRPIDYEPPKKDPRQRDLVDQIDHILETEYPDSPEARAKARRDIEDQIDTVRDVFRKHP
jgi:hypothetical protein